MPCIEVYITDESSGESHWVSAEPISQVICSEGYDYLSAEYDFDGEYYTEDFGPERVRRRGQLESVLELWEEACDVTSTTDIKDAIEQMSTYKIGLDNDVDKQGPVLQSFESKKECKVKNAWRASGHWVCQHGVFLLSHQECRCLEDDNGKGECNVVEQANPAAQRRSSDEKMQSASRHVSSHEAVAERFKELASADEEWKMFQEPAAEHLKTHEERKIVQADRELPRTQEMVVAAASAWSAAAFRLALRQVQLILPGLPEPELYLPTKDPNILSLDSSLKRAIDVPIGDEAV